MKLLIGADAPPNPDSGAAGTVVATTLALHRAIIDRSPGKFFSLLAGQVYWRVLQGGVPQGDLPTKSLRKTSGLVGLAKAQPGSMIPLRVGR